mgnify:CR=1 FL=1
MGKLQRVFEPIRIGKVTIPNRVVRTAHGTWIARGHVNDDLIAYHVARARGGAGLSYIEYTSVHPSSFSLGPWSWDDSCIPGYRKLVEAVHPFGMKLFQQLAHGGYMYPPADGPGWSASRMPNPLSGAVAVPMTREQVAEIVQAFGQAGRRANEAGLDGVELHVGHGYLLHQFLSPLTNHRDDEYGGSLENRMRFPLEIFDAVRKVYPAHRPLWVRLSATDWVEGGWDLDSSIAFTKALKARGCDAIHVSSGGVSSKQQIKLGPNYQVGFAAAIKEATGLTTIAVGLITEAEQAEAIIAKGEADAVCLARGMLYDPRWPWHAAAKLGVSLPAPKQYWRSNPREHADLFKDAKVGMR